jgi:hypothetical protein
MVLQHLRTATLLLATMLMLVSCSEDSPPEQAQETTAPVVVGAIPVQGQTDVGLTQTITISFSEDMDPASATGHVTLSHGTVNDIEWTDARNLVVGHTAWPEGTEVTVTVGTSVTDVAGNGLAEVFSWTFWTWTDDVLLQDTSPAQGTTGVPINTTIWLRFSEPMNGATLPGAITVSSPVKAVLAYTLGSTDNTEWTLTMDQDLPTSTEITVTVTTAAQNAGGDPLAAEATFSFTTGVDADITPPSLVSFDPANGTSIDTDLAFVRLTFNEPMLTTSLDPSMVSGQFMTSLLDPENPGVWSENQTVFTLGLRTPLVPGAIFRVEFDSYADINGNVNETGSTWQVTVNGTAQHYPVRDGWLQYYSGSYAEMDSFPSSGRVDAFSKCELKTDGEFWIWGYDQQTANPAKELPVFVQYDRMEETATAILMAGFHEVRDSVAVDTVIDPAVEWLRLPVTTSSWSGTSSFTEGSNISELDYTVTVLPGSFDLDVPADENTPALSWLACRKVALQYEVGDGVDVFSAGNDTLWYAPGAGLVREINHNDSENRTYFSDKTLRWAGPVDNWPSN